MRLARHAPLEHTNATAGADEIVAARVGNRESRLADRIDQAGAVPHADLAAARQEAEPRHPGAGYGIRALG